MRIYPLVRLEQGGIRGIGFREIDRHAEERKTVRGRLLTKVQDLLEKHFRSAALQLIHLSETDVEEVPHGRKVHPGNAVERGIQGLVIDFTASLRRGLDGIGFFHYQGKAGNYPRFCNSLGRDIVLRVRQEV
jgi:hypothetical protein